MAEWDSLLSESERAVYERGKFGRTVGFGQRPALLIVDAQNYMVGAPSGSKHEYPVACGESARKAVSRLVPLVHAARNTGVPIIYTRFELRRDGSDAGVHAFKRPLFEGEGWCLERTEGTAIVSELMPDPSDVVLVKKKPSAFHATTLLDLLLWKGVDTVLIGGGSTSNCVRATAVDAASFNFHTVVIRDCVFDRFALSHRVSLFDLHRQHADLVTSDEILLYLKTLDGGCSVPHA